jgi:hypothetical protein
MRMVEQELPQYLPQSVRNDALTEIRFFNLCVKSVLFYKLYVIKKTFRKSIDISE